MRAELVDKEGGILSSVASRGVGVCMITPSGEVYYVRAEIELISYEGTTSERFDNERSMLSRKNGP